jgi:hypothetical protein
MSPSTDLRLRTLPVMSSSDIYRKSVERGIRPKKGWQAPQNRYMLDFKNFSQRPAPGRQMKCLARHIICLARHFLCLARQMKCLARHFLVIFLEDSKCLARHIICLARQFKTNNMSCKTFGNDFKNVSQDPPSL